MGCEIGNYRTASLHTFICGGCPTAEQFSRKSNMNRETCVFYASWLDAIEAMPEGVRGEALMAILKYALRGETTEKQGAMTKVIMAMAKPVIDTNNKRYENGCKGGEYGKLGGRPKSAENPKETPKKPQENPKKTPNGNLGVSVNVNDNDNVNVNDNESVCDKSHNNAPTHTLTHEGFEKFIDFCRAKAPLSLAFEEQLSVDMFDWLVAKYGLYKVQCCASDLHNKEAYKKNRNANNTYKRWIKNIS